MKALTVGQVAKRLDCAPRTVTKWFDKGWLKGYRLPGSSDRRITESNLKEFTETWSLPYEEQE